MHDEQKGGDKPDRLKTAPSACSAEQIRICHGEVRLHPCPPIAECQDPSQLKTMSPGCSNEQVRKCHGDVKEHPCA